ncbi:MAG: hypothetical protein ABIJ61_14830, partial [bacterium]
MRRSILILFAATLLFLMLAVTANAQQSLGDSMFKKGDTFKVRMDIEDFDGLKNSSSGDLVTVKVDDNVERYGDRLISRLSPVYCTVIKRKGPGSFGGGGHLIVQIDSVHSTGGDMVPLRGEIELKGGGKLWPKIIFLVGWAVKGSDITFPENEADR